MSQHDYSPWHPEPVLYLNDRAVAACSDQLDSQPVVLDGIVIEWGRTSYVDMPEPATLTVRLIDRAGSWLAPEGRARVGTRVEIVADPKDDDTWTVFRGRLASTLMRPGPVPAGATTPDHWIIELTATDITAEFGNQIVADEVTLDHERAILRANYLRSFGAETNIDAVYFDPDAVDWYMAKVDDIGGASLLDMLGTFYRSTGATWAYNPRDNTIRDQYRLSSDSMGLNLVTAADGHSAFIQPDGVTYTGETGPDDPATITYDGVPLDGCTLYVEDDAADVAPVMDANRVECSWLDAAMNESDPPEITTTVDLPRESWDTDRVMSYDSWLGDGLQVDPILDEWAERLEVEGSLPKHPDIVYDTTIGPHAGGFLLSGNARALLQAGETPRAVFVAGSAYTPAFADSTRGGDRPPPIYTPIGGVIEYADGWRVTMRLQSWDWTQDPDDAITWDDLEETELEWGYYRPGGEPAPFTMMPGVTWLDLSGVGNVIHYD